MIRYFLLWMSLLMGVVYAQENFYQNKIITIVVGVPAGGGYDIYARLLSRHINKHIPGNPTVVVTNMPGAGSHVAADYVSNIAKKDGTVIGALMMGSIAEPILKKKSFNHDPSKYNYIGSINTDYNVCIYNTKSGIKSFQDVINNEYIIGAAAAGSESNDWAVLMKNTVTPKVKIVSGYGSVQDQIRALIENEVNILCAQSYSIITSIYKANFDNGTFKFLVQMDNENGAAVLKDVPNLKDFAKTEEAKRVLELVFSQKTFSRPYVVANEVPQEQVEILRKAFNDTMVDKEFLADASNIHLDTNYLTGDKLQSTSKEVYSTPSELIDKVSEYME
jgi:tripartite-type tricarboxylate transporter receptor subunit TctC